MKCREYDENTKKNTLIAVYGVTSSRATLPFESPWICAFPQSVHLVDDYCWRQWIAFTMHVSNILYRLI